MLAKAAHGLADDLLTNTLLTARCPVVFAPAMHTEMWEHPATQENVATLRRRGAVVIEPAVGRLTGVDTGKGRLPDPAEIFEVCRRVLARGVGRARTSPGRHVVVSAGGTREPLDPVRFLGNRSSGKQGYALARTAAARGARVTLIAANTGLPDPAGVDVVQVGTAVQLREAVLKAAADADAVVMAAAVADFRPAAYAAGKIKKKDGQEPEPDRPGPQSGHPRRDLRRPRPPRPGDRRLRRRDGRRPRQRPRRSCARKGCDLLVVNEVGERKTFGSEENEAVVLGADGSETPVPYGPKEALADTVWDLVAPRARAECLDVAATDRSKSAAKSRRGAPGREHDRRDRRMPRAAGHSAPERRDRWPDGGARPINWSGRRRAQPPAGPPMISQQPLQPQGAMCPAACSPRSP